MTIPSQPPHSHIKLKKPQPMSNTITVHQPSTFHQWVFLLGGDSIQSSLITDHCLEVCVEMMGLYTVVNRVISRVISRVINRVVNRDVNRVVNRDTVSTKLLTSRKEVYLTSVLSVRVSPMHTCFMAL